MLLPTEPLITNPTWIVLVVLGLILFTPMVLERLKIPSIVGLIVAGMLVGRMGSTCFRAMPPLNLRQGGTFTTSCS